MAQGINTIRKYRSINTVSSVKTFFLLICDGPILEVVLTISFINMRCPVVPEVVLIIVPKKDTNIYIYSIYSIGGEDKRRTRWGCVYGRKFLGALIVIILLDVI